MKASERSQVPPFAVMSVLQRVAELRARGRDVISLCAGEPSQGAPSDVRRRAEEVLADRRHLGYSETFGIRPLRMELARHYRRWYGLEVDPDQIALTTGSSGAFVLAFLAAFGPGDRVALTRPGYPAYRNIFSTLGCEVVELDCGEEVRFQPTACAAGAAHEQAPLAGLVVASPANPTGTMLAPDQLAGLVTWCREHDVRLISDEIYHGVTFTGSVGTCAWQFDPRSIVISSFSKFWGMTGWRLGWCLLPSELVAAVDALAGNFALCPPVPAQHAAIGRLHRSVVRRGGGGRPRIRRRPGSCCWPRSTGSGGARWLRLTGRSTCTPTSADVLGPYADSEAWCAALLDSEGVALTPGTDFDRVHGRTAVRLSLAAGPEAVAAAVVRILRVPRSTERLQSQA